MSYRPQNRSYFANKSSRSSKKTAKCPYNQDALDKMIQRYENAQGHYQITLGRAINSVVAHPDPITSFKEAKELKYIGDGLANTFFRNKCNNNAAAAASSKATKKRKKKASSSDDNDESSDEDATAAVAVAVERAAPRQRKAPPPLASASAAAAGNKKKGNKKNAGANVFKDEPTKKEIAYNKCVARALDWKRLQLEWKVVLLVDGREPKSEHIRAKCQMSGIPCEERHLPIGDMTWIAQGFLPRADTSSAPKVELLLGTIIERKSTEDLKSSLFGTRYAEQRLRLQHCGLPQVLFLIEGDLKRELFKCPANTLHTAVWETRLHLGFQIVHTQHMDDTVKNLKRLHRRILHRTFSAHFGTGAAETSQALPTFAEADVRRRGGGGGLSLEGGSGGRLDGQGRRRRQRRRLTSLHEMMFDTTPSPPLGTERFITYEELKAKVEMDREAALRCIGKIHQAMLKQVPAFSSKKCQAIARHYPTAHSLLAAYDQEAPDDRTSLVAEIATQDPNATSTSTRDLKIGPKSADGLYIAYGLAQEQDEELRASFPGGNATAARAATGATAGATTAGSTTGAATDGAATDGVASKDPSLSTCSNVAEKTTARGSGSKRKRQVSAPPAAAKPLPPPSSSCWASSDDESVTAYSAGVPKPPPPGAAAAPAALPSMTSSSKPPARRKSSPDDDDDALLDPDTNRKLSRAGAAAIARASLGSSGASSSSRRKSTLAHFGDDNFGTHNDDDDYYGGGGLNASFWDAASPEWAKENQMASCASRSSKNKAPSSQKTGGQSQILDLSLDSSFELSPARPVSSGAANARASSTGANTTLDLCSSSDDDDDDADEDVGGSAGAAAASSRNKKKSALPAVSGSSQDDDETTLNAAAPSARNTQKQTEIIELLDD